MNLQAGAKIGATTKVSKSYKSLNRLQTKDKALKKPKELTKRILSKEEISKGECLCGGCIWSIGDYYTCGDCGATTNTDKQASIP